MVRVLDHHSARGEVSQPLALPVDEQHDQTHAVAVRQEVDDAHDVADASLDEGQRLTSIAYSAQSKRLLADRLS